MHKQLRWGGLLIIVISIFLNGTNILIYSNYRSAFIQAVYSVGYIGLVLIASLIHISQARRAGTLGLVAYLLSVLSVVYSNVVTFLTLADLAGIHEARQAFLDIWDPVMRSAVYGVFIGWTLLGISIAQARVFPSWSGILLALGMALQLPSQYALELSVPLLFIFTIGGSILVAAGLIGIGKALWSGKGWNQEEPGLSSLDRSWGGPFVIATGILLAMDAMVNMFGGLSLASGITHLLSYTTIVLAAFVLFAAHGSRVSWTGLAAFLFTQVGATLYIITAYLIFAQLAGAVDNNRAMMASWEDIPVGRYGGYMVIVGMFLFGVEAIQSGVFPRWSGWLVLIGIALALPFLFTIQAYYLGIFWVLGAMIEGVGIAWMGWTLLPGRKVLVEQVPQSNL